jgi:predicted nucleic acid-binding protein
VRVFCDTSVLIPLFYGDHHHHDASIRAVESLQAGEGFCGSHSLVEVYSSLTRMPGRYRVSPERARLFVADLREKFQGIALTAEEYAATLDHQSAAGITGGAIYDAMIAQCAVKAGAEILLTWNLRDFARFGPEIGQLVKTPPEFQPGQ